MNDTITIDRIVWQRVGRLSRQVGVGTRLTPTVFPDDRYGLLVYWPKAWRFLDLECTHSPPADGGKPAAPATPFKRRTDRSDEEDAVDALFKSLRLGELNRFFTPEVLRDNHYLAAAVARGSALRFTVTVDTNDPEFCAWARECVKQAEADGGPAPDPEAACPLELPVKLTALVHRVRRGAGGAEVVAPQSEKGELTVQLGPGLQPRLYRGMAALDFGTTASTLVALPANYSQHDPVGDILVLRSHAEGAPRGGLRRRAQADPGGPTDAPPDPDLTFDSVVRMEAVERAPDQRPDETLSWSRDYVDWRVGRLARGRGAGAEDREQGKNRVVMGPKRLAAGPDWERRLLVEAYDQLLPPPNGRVAGDLKKIPLLRREPAELFICRMFEHFCEATNCRPQSLAITYPSTYTREELLHLKEVVARGWLRMRIRKPDRERIDRIADPPRAGDGDGPEADALARVELALDEATAAAYFFLSREIMRPGGLPRFTYLYPRGVNLLLVDCGGGTTDVALVSAESGPGAVSVKVEATSGARDFGGDNITEEILRLFKAQLALRLAGGQHRYAGRPEVKGLADALKPGADPGGLAGRLRAAAHFANEVVPTQFDPAVFDVVSNTARNLAWRLWEYAEELKREFGKEPAAAAGGPARPPAEAKLDLPQGAQLPAAVAGLAAAHGLKPEALADHLRAVRIPRAHVDALIRGRLDRIVRNCNNLIRDHLTAHGKCLHWVIAAGNASRYPLVTDQLLTRLNTLDVGERFDLDQENLKLAVASGALLGLAAQDEGGQMLLKFESKLSEKLPFGVYYWNDELKDYREVYPVHRRYDQLGPVTVPFTAQPDQPPADDRVPNRRFRLFYRWPGEEREDTRTLRIFLFPRAIAGPLTVSFDPDTGRFQVDDQNGPGELLPPDGGTDVYRSPIERGDL